MLGTSLFGSIQRVLAHGHLIGRAQCYARQHSKRRPIAPSNSGKFILTIAFSYPSGFKSVLSSDIVERHLARGYKEQTAIHDEHPCTAAMREKAPCTILTPQASASSFSMGIPLISMTPMGPADPGSGMWRKTSPKERRSVYGTRGEAMARMKVFRLRPSHGRAKVKTTTGLRFLSKQLFVSTIAHSAGLQASRDTVQSDGGSALSLYIDEMHEAQGMSRRIRGVGRQSSEGGVEKQLSEKFRTDALTELRLFPKPMEVTVGTAPGPNTSSTCCLRLRTCSSCS